MNETVDYRGISFMSMMVLLVFVLSSCTERGDSVQGNKEKKGVPFKTDVSTDKMMWIEGGDFTMGVNNGMALPGEGPSHEVRVNGFYIDLYEVTNRDFKAFVDETGYITTAEKKPVWDEIKNQFPDGTKPLHDSLLQPGSVVYFSAPGVVDYRDYTQWWSFVHNACWKHPFGPISSIDSLMDHPVVHVSWHDAKAYARWIGKDLPTEAEWELAAGGNQDYIYPWGNNLPDDRKPQANYFQGRFPSLNTARDGYIRTSPVGSYPENFNGLYDMGGNVWEWCNDWYHVDYYLECAKEGVIIDPKGAITGYDPVEPYVEKKIVKGGSYLCNDSYCSGYKLSRRMHTDPFTSSDHTGFRCVIRRNE